MVELDAVAIDEADGCVGTECGDRELFKEISPNLMVCVLLPFGLICLGLCGYPFAGSARSRLVMHLRGLPTRLGGFVCRPLPGLRRFRFWR